MFYHYKAKNARKLIIFIFFMVQIIVAIHFVLEAGMGCVDSNGCLKDWCDKEWLNESYLQIVEGNLYNCQ